MPVSLDRARPRRPRVWLWTLLALACLEIAGNLASAPTLLAPLPLTSAPDNILVRERAECLRVLGAERWHKLGFRGHGARIAVLDSGFRGYRAFLGKSLPAQVLARSFRKDGNLEARDSQHGI